MADEQTGPELDWIETCAGDIAEEARDILSEVLHEMDLLAGLVVIQPHGPTRLPLQVGEGGELVHRRARVALMLVARGVLRSAKPYEPRGPYAGPEGVLIEADETIVRRAHGLLDDRLRGRAHRATTSIPAAPPALTPPRSSLPKNQQDAQPPQSPAPAAIKEPRKHERLPREFKQGF